MLITEDTITSLKCRPQQELPSLESLICILKKCRKSKNLAHAKRVHTHIQSNGLEAYITIGNHLVPLYVECGSMSGAQQVFFRLIYRNEFSWTSLIQGYTEYGESQLALKLFNKMQEDCVCPSGFTFVAVMKACAKQKCKERSQELHSEVVKHGIESELFVSNTLVDMYAKCGSLLEAQEVFDKLLVRDIVSWNALLGGYAELGLGIEALRCLEQMQPGGVLPDLVTFICSLKACISIEALDKGQKIHTEIVKEGFEENYFLGSILLAMYAKCGLLTEARDVFDNLPVRDAVLWTALITGYAEHGFNEEAMNCFKQLHLEGVSADPVSWTAVILGYAKEGESEKAYSLYAQMLEQGLYPDRATYVSILIASGTTACLESGKKIHAQLYMYGGVEATEVVIATTLIDMYSKCGNMVDAQQVFDAISTKGLPVWNAFVTGYARQGESETVFCLFESMREEGMQPDAVTFLSVLTVCSHAGLLDKGQKYFKTMSGEYSIMPTLKHLNCMVDLLGRAGRLNEAVVMLKKSPFLCNAVACITLLGACQKWNDVELGRQVFDHASSLDAKHAAVFFLMSNIYADDHMCKACEEELSPWESIYTEAG